MKFSEQNWDLNKILNDLIWNVTSSVVLTTSSQLSGMGNTDRIMTSTAKLTEYIHHDFFFQV